MSEDKNQMFETISETVGYDGFSAEIVDGTMHITPADAGIHLFAYIQNTEEIINEHISAVDNLRQELDETHADNSVLRDLLERCYAVLLDAGQVELADEVITAAYPVKGITEIRTGE